MVQWLRLLQYVSTLDVGNELHGLSQPNFPGTKIAAGNLLLSFGILVAGTSATKVFRVLRHMGMTCVSLTTFFEYQRVSVPMGLMLFWLWLPNLFLVMVAKFVLSSPKSYWL